MKNVGMRRTIRADPAAFRLFVETAETLQVIDRSQFQTEKVYHLFQKLL
jgi:hypothetical protein